jgi:hypothetical protein
MSLRIAVIGYGSLPNQLRNYGATLEVEAPAEPFPSGLNLNPDSPFRPAGLSLPVLLGRVSGAGTEARRITMILQPGATDVPVLYAVSRYTNLRQAKENLRKREGCQTGAIGYVRQRRSKSRIPEIADKVRIWARQKGFDAVIWTDLEAEGVEFGAQPTGREILPLLTRDLLLLRNTKAYIRNLVQRIPLHDDIQAMSDDPAPVAEASARPPAPSMLDAPPPRSSKSFWKRIGPFLALTVVLIFLVMQRSRAFFKWMENNSPIVFN